MVLEHGFAAGARTQGAPSSYLALLLLLSLHATQVVQSDIEFPRDRHFSWRAGRKPETPPSVRLSFRPSVCFCPPLVGLSVGPSRRCQAWWKWYYCQIDGHPMGYALGPCPAVSSLVILSITPARPQENNNNKKIYINVHTAGSIIFGTNFCGIPIV